MAKRSLEELADREGMRPKKRRKKHIEEADWSGVDAEHIKRFVVFAQCVNGAVRFGRSRDGEVYSIGFYVGTERFTEWVRSTDDRDYEFECLLAELYEDYEIKGPVFDDRA